MMELLVFVVHMDCHNTKQIIKNIKIKEAPNIARNLPT